MGLQTKKKKERKKRKLRTEKFVLRFVKSRAFILVEVNIQITSGL
jgi:hypothetical protein